MRFDRRGRVEGGEDSSTFLSFRKKTTEQDLFFSDASFGAFVGLCVKTGVCQRYVWINGKGTFKNSVEQVGGRGQSFD